MHKPYIVVSNIISINTIPIPLSVSCFAGERDLVRWIQRCLVWHKVGLRHASVTSNKSNA